MSALELKLYDILKAKLGESEATTFFEFIETKTEAKYDQKKDIFLTIEDKSKLLTKEDAYKIFATKEDIKDVKVDLVKWMISLFVTLALMIIGLYLK